MRLEREVVRGRGQDEAGRRHPHGGDEEVGAPQDAHADAHKGQDAGHRRVNPVPVEGQCNGDDDREDEGRDDDSEHGNHGIPQCWPGRRAAS